MKQIRKIILATFVLGLAACSQTAPSGPEVSRSEPLNTQLLNANAPSTFHVADVRISVPKTLVVSEANGYFPTADIVWRGESYGDRHQQVAAIFDEALTRGVENMHGSREIYVEIEVTRFHSLTQRARYTVGGVHSIKFVMTLRDKETGAILQAPKLIKADLKAFGGTKATASERRGETQKVRIVSHLADLIKHEVNAL